MKTKEESQMHNWSSYCSVDDNRNQCSEKNCTIYPVCRIKQTRTQTLAEVKEKIKKLIEIIELKIRNCEKGFIIVKSRAVDKGDGKDLENLYNAYDELLILLKELLSQLEDDEVKE